MVLINKILGGNYLSKNIDQEHENEIEKIFDGELKKLFFERALSSFLKKQFISGLKILLFRWN